MSDSELTDEECDRLSAYFAAGAGKITVQDAYWVDGADSGDDYCRACAEKELVRKVALYRRLPRAKKRRIERPSLGGGYRIEHDHLPYCEKCGASLDGSLTAYGCEEEIRHFLEHGFEIDGEYSDHNRYAMDEVLTSMGWRAWENEYDTEWKRDQYRKLYANLHALGRRILDALNSVLNEPRS